MIYEEKRINLFEVPKEYYFVHCIAADARMGAGIAIQFVKEFPYIKRLRKENNKVGTCVRIKRVLNLITKKVSTGKPSYSSLHMSLLYCRDICIKDNIKFLAMPKIGCGLDGLSWPIVSNEIKDVFKDIDITIKVCFI